MDRDRLKDVQQTDLTESRVNQEFLFWLKEKGPTWLLVVLVGLVAWVGWGKYQQYRQNQHSEAFFDLEQADAADSFAKVAEDHEGVGAVGLLARLRAGDAWMLEAHQGRDTQNPEEELSADEVNDRLSKADEMYRAVLEASRGEAGLRLFAVQAQFGLAAIAEARGELDAAAEHYQAAADAAGEAYEPLKQQALSRKETLADLDPALTLPRREDLPRPSPVDPLLRDLLAPQETEAPAGSP